MENFRQIEEYIKSVHFPNQGKLSNLMHAWVPLRYINNVWRSFQKLVLESISSHLPLVLMSASMNTAVLWWILKIVSYKTPLDPPRLYTSSYIRTRICWSSYYEL